MALSNSIFSDQIRVMMVGWGQVNRLESRL